MGKGVWRHADVMLGKPVIRGTRAGRLPLTKGATAMAMKNPPHPGCSIKDACLAPLELSVTQGAKILGVTRHTLSRVINGRSGISPDMAIRLEKAGWSNAEHWLRLQMAFELAAARAHEDQIQVERYEPHRAAW